MTDRPLAMLANIKARWVSDLSGQVGSSMFPSACRPFERGPTEQLSACEFISLNTVIGLPHPFSGTYQNAHRAVHLATLGKVLSTLQGFGF